MIVKIVKEDLDNNKKSLVKRKLPNSKKASDFITQVDPNKVLWLHLLTKVETFHLNRTSPYTDLASRTNSRLVIGDQSPKDIGKKTLVIDLDETLVHSSTEPCECDLVVTMASFSSKIYVTFRPGVFEFLEHVSKNFECLLFTASVAEYADEVIKVLERNMTFAYKLYRPNCTTYRGSYVKDLSQLNRPMKDILLLDNSPISFLLQPENGVLIKNFYFDKKDTELFDMIPLLDFFSELYDVRPIETWRSFFRDKKDFNYLSMSNEPKKYNFLSQEDSSIGDLSNDSTVFLAQKDFEKTTEKIVDERHDFNSPTSNIKKFEFEFDKELQEYAFH